jgi:hypothetical protein
MLRASRLRSIPENLCSKNVFAFLYIMNGGSASYAYNATPWLSAIADLGGYPTNILGAGIDGTLSTCLFVRATPIATIHESLRSARCSSALHTSVAITAWHFPIQTILLPWRSEEA